MTQYITPLRKKLFLLLVPVLVGIVYLGGTVLSSSSKSPKGTVKINNLTHSCEILSAEKHNGHIKISFRNNNDKAITAYVFSNTEANDSYSVAEEFAFSEGDAVISPGQIYDKVIGIPAYLNRRDEVVFNLSAIMLEDSIGEGDPKIIRNIKDYRLGEKVQLMKALPVIDKLLRLSDTEIPVHWDKTARHDFEVALDAPDTDWLIQLNKGPLNNHDPDNKSQFELGIQSGKEYVLRKHQEMKDMVELQGTAGMREDLTTLRDLYAKMIARL